MATLESNDANILDAEAINWRLIVYPVLAVLVLAAGGFAYYYYELDQRDQLEAQARAVMVQAKTPEALVKMADQFPGTDQAILALMSAAGDSFDQRDFTAAIADYQRIIGMAGVDASMRDSAQLGLASALEGSGKPDDAINAYLEVAHRGDKSPFAPFAYHAVASIYEQRGDKDNQRKILSETASLSETDSMFVKEAQAKLKQLKDAAQPPMTINVPANEAPVPPPAPANAPPMPPAPVSPPAK